MKLCIITQERNNKSCQILKVELEKLGHQVDLIEYKKERLRIRTSSYDEKQIIYDFKLLDPQKYDGVMLREWGYYPDVAEEVISIFEAAGVTSINPKRSRRIASSKIQTYDILSQMKLAQPLSAVYTHSTLPDYQQLKEAGFTFPCIIKKDISCRGNGVWFCENFEKLREIISEIFLNNEQFLLQQFIDTGSKKKLFQYYRAVVVEEKVIAFKVCFSSKTQIVNGSNAERQAKLIDCKEMKGSPLYSKMAELAVKASNAIGIEISGVDLVLEEATNNIYVLEVNDGPGISSFNELGCSAFSEQVAFYFSQKVIQQSRSNEDRTVSSDKARPIKHTALGGNVTTLAVQLGLFSEKTNGPTPSEKSCVSNTKSHQTEAKVKGHFISYL